MTFSKVPTNKHKDGVKKQTKATYIQIEKERMGENDRMFVSRALEANESRKIKCIQEK